MTWLTSSTTRLGAVGAERGVHVVEAFFPRRLLGDDVDRAAGGAAACKGRARAAQDFDLLGEEILAHADAGVAHAVEEDIVAGIEAADKEAVAEGIAALAGAERHAGRAQDRLLQRGGVLVLQHLLAQHRDRLRRVQQRLGKFARRLQVIDLVGRRRIRIGVAVGAEAARIGKRHCCDLRRLRPSRGAAQSVAGADLVRSRFRHRRARPLDRGIDRHRRQVRLLRFSARERRDCDQTGDRRDFSTRITIEGFVDEIHCRDCTQRPRCYCLTHPTRPEPDPHSLMRFNCDERWSVGIQRKNQGQCDHGFGLLEYVQIKTIVKSKFEIVLRHGLQAF